MKGTRSPNLSSTPTLSSGKKLPLTTRASLRETSNAFAEGSSAIKPEAFSTLPNPTKNNEHRDTNLTVTLRACLDEVRRLDFHNSELERNLRKAESRTQELAVELDRLKASLAERANLEEVNIRLQAKLLALERSGNSGEHLLDQLEVEKQAYKELEQQYRLLDSYYNELLMYVRDSEREKDASPGEPVPAESTNDESCGA